MTPSQRAKERVCPDCGGTGWLHGAQEWTEARMRKGTPYKSVRCACRAALSRKRGRK